MAPAFLCGAAASVLFTVPGVIDRLVPVMLGACALGLFTGWGIHTVGRWNSISLGLETGTVTSFEGYLLDDGSDAGSGFSRYRLKLRRVGDINGWQAGASGELILYCDNLGSWAQGARLYVNAPLVPRVHEGKIIYTCKAGKGDILQDGWKSPLFRLRQRIRKSLVHRIRCTGEKSGPLLEALLLGVRDDLSLFEESLFRRSGCMHILALSGMHLGIFTGLLYVILRVFLRKTVSSVFVVAAVFLYLLIAGFKPSLVRGVIMITLVWIGLLTGRRSSGLNILLGTFVLQSILFPFSGDTLSFQLSFLALGGIFLASPPLARNMARFLPGWISSALAASLGAQTATSSLVLSRFRVIYPVGILASLLLTPLITLFIWIGILCLLLERVSFLQAHLHRLADMIYDSIVLSASWFSRIPGIDLGQPVPVTVYVLMLALILGFPFIPRGRSG